ncbi:MAG: hypothetical protein Q9168_006916 [Polycauliona sp. 1 TL-2023]
MASFVYNSTNASASFASLAKSSGQALVAAESCRLKVLEWPDNVIWLHTLCKNLTLVRGIDGSPSIQDPRGTQPSQESDGTWLRSGVVLRWKQAAAENNSAGEVDMIIFSPTISLQRNLESLIKRANWRHALEDPFCLLVVILDDLYRQVDEARAKVHNILQFAEHRVLENAGVGATGASFNFVSMYNIAKHVIHMKESSNGAFLVATRIAEAHRRLVLETKQLTGTETSEGVQALIQHKLALLESCKLQIQSLDSRAQNMTNLAFNTVNQQDSQTMKADSQSMKVIAIVTMFFLPAATIGSICGSQFFNFDSDNHKILMSVDFKFFWAVTVPLTFLVFGVYLLWRRLKGKGARIDKKSCGLRKMPP